MLALCPSPPKIDITQKTKISISQSAPGWRCRLLATASVLWFGGCGGGTPVDVSLLWRLADGRSCVDTALVRTLAEVEGQTPRTAVESRCSPRPENNRLSLLQVPPGAHIVVRGETLSQVVIYRGELRVGNPVPPLLETDLYYTGGQ